jgi:hypothetical protein
MANVTFHPLKYLNKEGFLSTINKFYCRTAYILVFQILYYRYYSCILFSVKNILLKLD